VTSRERVLAASRGGSVDRRPLLAWPTPNAHADVVVVPVGDSVPDGVEDRLVVAEVLNPFGVSLSRGIDLPREIADDPVQGNHLLDDCVTETRRQIETAMAAGADGILYRLHGAAAAQTTPMEYGGFFLERDRELLDGVAGATFNIIFVVGDEDVYLDFVSDLPAHAFGWDQATSGIDAAYVRTMRQGALVSTDPNSVFELTTGVASVARFLEPQKQLI